MQPSPERVVEMRRVTKTFGPVVALDDVSFSLGEGELVGFIGPNGAGKSTALRCLLDLLRPDAGEVLIFGRPVAAHPELRRAIGWLPSDMAFPSRTTGRAVLSHVQELHGLDAAPGRALADRFELDLDRRVDKLSRGNRQKLAIVQAFMTEPRLLVLDEPTSALDPMFQRSFHALLRERQAAGATVLMSSHVLSEVHHLADRVLVIADGRLVADGPIDEVVSQAGQPATIDFHGPVAVDGRVELARLVEGIWTQTPQGSRLRGTFRGDPTQLIAELARHDIAGLALGEPDLEDAFLGFFDGRHAASTTDTREPEPVA